MDSYDYRVKQNLYIKYMSRSNRTRINSNSKKRVHNQVGGGLEVVKYPVNGGIYRISNIDAWHCIANNNAKPTADVCAAPQNQMWKAHHLGGNKFRFESQSSPGKCIYANGLQNWGANINVLDCTDASEWNLNLNKVADGTFGMMTEAGRCFYVAGGRLNAGRHGVGGAECNPQKWSDQTWTLARLDGSPTNEEKSGKAYGSGCNNDLECQGSQLCINSTCSDKRVLSSCATDAHCLSGNSCILGKCSDRSVGKTCSDNTHCDATKFLECNAGTCQVKAKQPPDLGKCCMGLAQAPNTEDCPTGYVPTLGKAMFEVSQQCQVELADPVKCCKAGGPEKLDGKYCHPNTKDARKCAHEAYPMPFNVLTKCRTIDKMDDLTTQLRNIKCPNPSNKLTSVYDPITRECWDCAYTPFGNASNLTSTMYEKAEQCCNPVLMEDYEGKVLPAIGNYPNNFDCSILGDVSGEQICMDIVALSASRQQALADKLKREAEEEAERIRLENERIAAEERKRLEDDRIAAELIAAEIAAEEEAKEERKRRLYPAYSLQTENKTPDVEPVVDVKIEQEDDLPIGTIIGGSIGGLCCCCFLICLCIIVLSRKK